MKRLYSARNALEAHDLRFFLESNGIEARVFGDNSPLEAGFSFTPASAPGVFVREEDFDRAAELVDVFLDQSDLTSTSASWTCKSCGERVEGQFEVCWNCETFRGDGEREATTIQVVETTAHVAEPANVESHGAAMPNAPAIPVRALPVDRSNELWLEIAVVLAVAWLPSIAYAFLPVGQSNEISFVADSLWTMVNYVPTVAVVLYLIHRSGMRWAKFGIRRPRLFFDVVAGTLIWITLFAMHIMIHWWVERLPEFQQIWEIGRSPIQHEYPQTTLDFVMLIPLCLMIGFSEELAMRGYLVTRLNQALHSKSKAIVFAGFFFASWHLYQGLGPMLVTLVYGLLFGLAFLWLRRLWPLVIAHALWDVVAYAIPEHASI